MEFDLERAEAFEGARRGAGLALWEAAQSWIGTPYEHCQRTKGVGVDCVNLILCAAAETNLFRWEEWNVPTQYSPWTNTPELMKHIDRLVVPVPEDGEEWTGDILLFDIKGSSQHVGVFAAPCAGRRRPRLVHACASAGRVVEHDYERFWRSRTVGRYRWRLWLDNLEDANG